MNRRLRCPLGGHDAFSGNDDQHLIAVMGMKSVFRSFAKIHDIQAEVLAIRHERLFGYIGSGKKDLRKESWEFCSP